MHVFFILLADKGALGQAISASSRFVFEQVAFVGFPTLDLTTACGSKALGSSLSGFQFRHGLPLIRHNQLIYHTTPLLDKEMPGTGDRPLNFPRVPDPRRLVATVFLPHPDPLSVGLSLVNSTPVPF